MFISEIFQSIQGEGILAGVPSIFIRTSGCNLRCTWCDTPYASWNPEGEEMTIEAILDRVHQFSAKHIVLTGGEPMIAKGIHDLAAKLHAEKYHITIETAATIPPNGIACDLASLSPKLSNSTPSAHFKTLSFNDRRVTPEALPRGPRAKSRGDGTLAAAGPAVQQSFEMSACAGWIGRHERDRLNLDVIRHWIDQYSYQLKFVVSQSSDLKEIEHLLASLQYSIPPSQVLLMPEGIDEATLGERSHWLVKECQMRGYRFCPRLHIALFGNKRGT